MEYLPLLVIALLIVILAAGCYYSYREYKRRLQMKIDIPQEELEIFNEAERRYAQSNGETNPYKIIYELTQERRKQNRINAGAISPNTSTESTNGENKLDTELNRRESLQSGDTSSVEQHNGIAQQPEQNHTGNKTGLLSRLFRKK